MKNVTKNAGLSARQKTGKKFCHINIFSITMLLGCTLVFFACNENTNGQTSKNEIKRDSVSQPNVKIRVNRHYDDKGNVVGFDSTYTSFYADVNGDTATMDSMMRGFDRYFNLRHPFLLQNEFAPLFFNDSLRYPDFFHRDYFMKRYELNDAYLRNMMQRMDSIKNRYFQERSKQPKESRTL
jgi:hypothetical protein